MKTAKYIELICKRYCNYYKDVKEDLTCETYNFLAEKFTPDELESKIHDIKIKPQFSCDEEIKRLICDRCEFLINGCDFRDGLDAPPCGGYAIIEWLIKKKALAKP